MIADFLLGFLVGALFVSSLWFYRELKRIGDVLEDLREILDEGREASEK